MDRNERVDGVYGKDGAGGCFQTDSACQMREELEGTGRPDGDSERVVAWDSSLKAVGLDRWRNTQSHCWRFGVPCMVPVSVSSNGRVGVALSKAQGRDSLDMIKSLESRFRLSIPSRRLLSRPWPPIQAPLLPATPLTFPCSPHPNHPTDPTHQLLRIRNLDHRL